MRDEERRQCGFCKRFVKFINPKRFDCEELKIHVLIYYCPTEGCEGEKWEDYRQTIYLGGV